MSRENREKQGDWESCMVPLPPALTPPPPLSPVKQSSLEVRRKAQAPLVCMLYPPLILQPGERGGGAGGVGGGEGEAGGDGGMGGPILQMQW